MFLTTRGIVFRQTRYSDSSLVVRILTEQLGLRSYIIKGARGPKSKLKSSLFQPLTLLDLVVNQKEKSDLQHIREAHPAYVYQSIPFDIRKSSILLFLNELLLKSIQEEAVNPESFRYIYDQLVLLDSAVEIPGHFHLQFAIQLTRFLGFFPQGIYSAEQSRFDLEEGQFTHSAALPGENFISGIHCEYFNKLLNLTPGDLSPLAMPAMVRNELLNSILRYYQFHLPLQGEFKSHIVLHEVLQK